MNCVWFETRLDDLLDQRLPIENDAALNEHIETCPHCARLLADHQALLEAVDLLVRPVAAAEFLTRIAVEMAPVPIARASGPRPVTTPSQISISPRTPLRTAIRMAATVAAALLVAAGVLQWTAMHQATTLADRRTPGRDLPSAQSQNRVSGEALIAGATDHRDLLAVQSVGEMEALASLIGPEQRTLMEQMSDGLKPVTHSMSAAFTALRRTFPGSESQRARG